LRGRKLDTTVAATASSLRRVGWRRTACDRLRGGRARTDPPPAWWAQTALGGGVSVWFWGAPRTAV